MLGTQPSHQQHALFSYYVNLDRRIPADHPLRKITTVLDLSFVIPTVRHCYGRSGNVSLDPRVIMKMLLLLFLYDVRSERELMEQIPLRLDFLWFLNFDLDTPVPDHSVLSKARARWGEKVFEQLFVRLVEQCVQAGLVDGSLLHVDSTIIKAQASRDSVVTSGPELVSALRQAYQEQQLKLQVLPEPQTQENQSVPAPGQCSEPEKVAAKKLPVNSTHISTTDPEAELARNKSGRTEPNYKEHRLVDDAHGVITAVAATSSNVSDAIQFPELYEQHLATSGLKQAQVTVSGDHHYGTASNYIYCAQEGLRPHLGDASANLEARGRLPLSQFVYELAQDRLRCPAGHHLLLHQNRPEEQAKVYLIEDPALCAGCALREQCTKSKRGRSIQRHVQAKLVDAARAEANSPAATYSRKRRRHVMEGSFADAFNNHGGRKARWRGLGRQRIQSWLIATVQNLRILLNHQTNRGGAVVERFGQAVLQSFCSQLAPLCDAGNPICRFSQLWQTTKPLRT